jgi:hypothetical protein
MKLTNAVKLISPIVVCVALSACATDYGSQLAEPNYGRHGMHYTEGNVDPTMLMNGTYASKQLNGPSMPLGAFCLTDYRCSPQSQLSVIRMGPVAGHSWESSGICFGPAWAAIFLSRRQY